MQKVKKFCVSSLFCIQYLAPGNMLKFKTKLHPTFLSASKKQNVVHDVDVVYNGFRSNHVVVAILRKFESHAIIVCLFHGYGRFRKCQCHIFYIYNAET